MTIDLVKKSLKNKLWNFVFKNFFGINVEDFLYPKIFIDKIDKSKIYIKKFYEYKKKFPNNKWNDLAKKFDNETYQSEHDLQNHKVFKELKIHIENLLNSKIKSKLFSEKKLGKFLIKNMWFTIMEKNNSHHSHCPNHFIWCNLYKKRESNDGMLNFLPKNILEYSDKSLNIPTHRNSFV